MQNRNIEIFCILIAVSGYVRLSSSFPGDFNFNGNIQKVNKLSFNSYFFERGQSSVPNPKDYNSSKTFESSAVKPAGRDDSDENSAGENKGEGIGAVRGDPEISEETSGLTPTDDEEKSILYSGLLVDYSFNETLAAGDDPYKQISAPGCPASAEKYNTRSYIFSNRSVWIHHGSPPRCYLVGSPGPCGKGMSLGLQPNSYVGKCKCKCFVEVTNQEYIGGPDKVNLDPFMDEKQNFCFDNDDAHFALYQEECHILLTQGPCEDNEVFVLSSITNKPSCEVRECPKEKIHKFETSKFGYAIKDNGKCSKLGQQCLNFTSAGVNTNDGLIPKYFVGTKFDNPMPSCVTEEEGVEFRVAITSVALEDGLQPSDCAKINQYFSKILRKCIPYNYRGRSGAVG